MSKYVGEIPFVYSPIKTPHNPEEIPDSLSFSLNTDDGLVRQVMTQETNVALDRAYRIGSAISGQMDDDGNGKEYADEFFDFVVNNVGSLAGRKILEIGCGTGYLLSRLQNGGADCIGCEPGETNVKYGIEKFGVNILQDYFKKELFLKDTRFDVIIFYGVLEHILDIGLFLSDVRAVLKNDGNVIIGVPNCQHHILHGDISMLLTEHWSYFTQDSLANLMGKYGFRGSVSESAYKGTLFGCFRQEKTEVKANKLNDDFETFCREFDIKRNIVSVYLKDATKNGKGLAVYVAGRFINWLSICREEIDISKIRFIDDNPLLEGTFYPGFDNAIENYNNFLENPTDNLFVATYTYENIILDKIRKSKYEGSVMTARELFA